MDDTERILELIETIDALKAEVARLRWIPVGERLPDDGQRVLFILLGGGWPVAGMYEAGSGFIASCITYMAAAHWMPLPAPPAAAPEGN